MDPSNPVHSMMSFKIPNMNRQRPPSVTSSQVAQSMDNSYRIPPPNVTNLNRRARSLRPVNLGHGTHMRSTTLSQSLTGGISHGHRLPSLTSSPAFQCNVSAASAIANAQSWVSAPTSTGNSSNHSSQYPKNSETIQNLFLKFGTFSGISLDSEAGMSTTESSASHRVEGLKRSSSILHNTLSSLPSHVVVNGSDVSCNSPTINHPVSNSTVVASSGVTYRIVPSCREVQAPPLKPLTMQEADFLNVQNEMTLQRKSIRLDGNVSSVGNAINPISGAISTRKSSSNSMSRNRRKFGPVSQTYNAQISGQQMSSYHQSRSGNAYSTARPSSSQLANQLKVQSSQSFTDSTSRSSILGRSLSKEKFVPNGPSMNVVSTMNSDHPQPPVQSVPTKNSSHLQAPLLRQAFLQNMDETILHLFAPRITTDLDTEEVMQEFGSMITKHLIEEACLGASLRGSNTLELVDLMQVVEAIAQNQEKNAKKKKKTSRPN